jgi:hypothetical protein
MMVLVGLFLLVLLIPVNPSYGLLGTVAAGIVLVWVGGILMGIGSRL